MNTRGDIEKRIDKERQKITEYQVQIAHSEAFIQGLQEALKLLPKDGIIKRRKAKASLRPGSDMAKVRELLKQAGKPMHIKEIVIGIGRSDTKPNRMSIAGSLGRYTRNEEIFKRVGPNKFGLKAMDYEEDIPIQLPPDFGEDERNCL